MDANRFYSVPYDARNDTAILKLRRKHGGIAAYGRWQALLGVLYDEGGTIDLSDEDNFAMVEREIELDGPDLEEFVKSCVKFGLLSPDLWSIGTIGSRGVCEELEYRRNLREKRSTAGKNGGRKSGSSRRRSEKEKSDEANDEANVEANNEANV